MCVRFVYIEIDLTNLTDTRYKGGNGERNIVVDFMGVD